MTGRGGLGLRKNKVNGELVDQKKQSGPTQPRDAEALEALGPGRDQAGGEAGPDTGGEDDFGRDSSHSDSDSEAKYYTTSHVKRILDFGMPCVGAPRRVFPSNSIESCFG